MIDFPNISFVIDSSGSINVNALEKVVWSMYNENGEQQMEAVKILECIRVHPQAWRSVNTVLKSQSSETKYFGLQLLEIIVKEKWKSLNPAERTGLKEYIMGICGEEGVDKVVLQILKRDWSLIQQLVSLSVQSEAVCINCMKILAQLTQDVVNSQRGAPLLELCRFVLEKAQSANLISTTLNTLKNLLSFLNPPPGLLQRISHCLSLQQLRNSALACLAEGLARQTDFEEVFTFSSEVLQSLEVKLSMNRAYLQSVTLFVTALLTRYYVELKQRAPELVYLGIRQLLLISKTEDRSLFMQCVEYWQHYVSLLYSNATEARVDVIVQLRSLIITRMAKPEEVIVVQLDDGTVVREQMKDTEEATLYKMMREVLIYLTHIDQGGMMSAIIDRLDTKIDINTTCWAIGSISGALIEDEEKKFIVLVIKDLLAMCEFAHTKDEKAAVASNIMYVVAQYQRFLMGHFKFLKTVVYKLFEFMHEMHEGVQDMACETFYKLVQRCRKKFVELQPANSTRFIEEIIANVEVIVTDLSQQQILVFYEALASSVKSELDWIALSILDNLMEMPNMAWNSTKYDFTNLSSLIQNIRINVRVCKQATNHFQRQMMTIFNDLIQVYGELSSSTDRLAYTLRSEILCLISTYLDECDSQPDVLGNMVPKLKYLILPEIEPRMLMLMTSLVNCLKEQANDLIYEIFGLVFPSTLKFISQDFVNYPELRVELGNFLYACLRNCLAGFLEFNEHNFGMIMHTILWFTQHPMHDVARLGFDCLRLLFGGKFRTIHPQKFMEFLQVYYMRTIDHILTLIVDPLYTSGGIKPYALLLADMMLLVEDMRERISPQSENVPYVFISLTEMLERRHSNSTLMKIFVEGLFSFDKDVKRLKKHLKDFIVQIREESGDDTSDLYLEEKAEEMSKARQEKAFARSKIPGLLDNEETFDNNIW